MKHPLYKSIKGRFLIITLVLMLLAGACASVFSYRTYARNLTNNMIHSAETNLHFFSSQIDSSLSEILYLTDYCRYNSNITAFVMTSKEVSNYNRATATAVERLNDEFLYNHSNSYFYRLVIASHERSDYLQVMASASYSVDKPLPSLIQELPYYKQLFDAPDYDFSVGLKEEPFLSQHPKMLPIIRPVYHPYRNTVIGFVYAEISTALITDVVSEYIKTEGTTVYFTAGTDTYAITPEGISPTKDLENLREFSSDVPLTQNISVFSHPEQNGLLYVTMPLNTPELSITLPVADNTPRDFSGYFKVLGPILILVSAAGIFLIITLSRLVTRPVHRLRERLLAISGGDFSLDASLEWDNEFGDIGKSVNQLAVDIQNLIDEKIAYEKQQKDYEYQVLQSQINPHFLYNTLNSIKWMASIQKAEGIAEMATALSHLLKNISKGTSTIVTIQEEITLLEDYFTIQKYRYGGTIELEYDIQDNSLLENQTLRFTLQPIVENAIFHGIEPKGQNGKITICIRRMPGETVGIDITDNGVGMTEEQIHAVLDSDSKKGSQFFRQLGISSVHKQIQYTFGEEYGLTIKSEPGVYTTMSVLLPLCPKETKVTQGEE